MRYQSTMEEEEIRRELKRFVVLIWKEFQMTRGSFEFFHVNRKFPEYTRGYHLRMISEGYLETIRFTGSGHARIWKLSEQAVEVAKMEGSR